MPPPGLKLVLEDGTEMRGEAFGADAPVAGEVVLGSGPYEALRSKRPHELGIVAWGDYMERRVVPLS